jgi:hypothetical protein
MKVDRIMFGYGTSTKAVLYSGLYDASSPICDELSREGIQFRLDYGGPWSVFQTIIKLLDDRFAQRRHPLRVASHGVPASSMPRRLMGQHKDFCSTTVPSANSF